MNKSVWVRWLLIVAVALSLTYMGRLYFKGAETEVTVYMPSRALEAQEVLTEDKIRGVQVGFKEAMTFFSRYETEKSALIGKVTLKPREKEHVFIKGDDALVVGEEGVSVREGAANDPYFIKDNQRLMKLNLSEVNAVGNRIHKGDYVDVVYTSKGKETGGVYSSMILQHVFVYDVAANGEVRELYLKMPSEQCVALTLAKNTGELTLLLNPLVGETTAPPVLTPEIFR